MNDELLQIPKRIKELREILEISITEMAEKLNIDSKIIAVLLFLQ